MREACAAARAPNEMLSRPDREGAVYSSSETLEVRDPDWKSRL